jgi:type II secretory pathway pseudopilin PulG
MVQTAGVAVHNRPQVSRRRTRRRLRVGLTLVELSIAIALTGILLLGARLVLESSTLTLVRLVRSDERASGERVAEALVRQLAASAASTASLVGTPENVEFASWCDVPDGWLEPCTVQLQVLPEPGGSSVNLSINGNESFGVVRAEGAARFLFLQRANQAPGWVEHWSEEKMPIAIGIVLPGDTLLFRLGGVV